MSLAIDSDNDLFTSLEEKWLGLEEDEIQKARNNDGETLNKIGEIYFEGCIYNKALSWYQKAAAQNNSNAQYRIGSMCHSGYGISVNHNLAMHWYLKAVYNDGNKEAQYSIGEYYFYGRQFTKNIHTAIEWYTKAASQGHIAAQYKLGWAYQNTNKVKDLQKSVNWYTKAADNDHHDAKSALKNLNNQGYYPKEEEKKNEQQTKNTNISNTPGEKIKDEPTNNNRTKEQFTSASHNVDCELKSLKDKFNELDTAFQLNLKIIEQEKMDNKKKKKELEDIIHRKFSFIEQEKKDDKEKNKTLEDEKEKIVAKQKEQIMQLEGTLAESRATLEEKQEKIKELEAKQKEKDEEIKIFKAALAYFGNDTKDKLNKTKYFYFIQRE